MISASVPVATESEAVEGIINDKAMTPLRVREAIDATNISAEAVSFVAHGSAAETTTVQDKLRRFKDVLDYIPPALHAAIRDGTNTTDLTAYIQTAIDAVISRTGYLRFPSGVYKTTNALTISAADRINLVGDGKINSIIARANTDGPIIILANASGPSISAGYYFEWHSFQLRFDPGALATDTDAIGISFETGDGDAGGGFVNFSFNGIEIKGAHTAISNDYGAGAPPNVWGWTWDDIVISNFSSRALYFTSGGFGGFPACRIGHMYVQGRAGLTYEAAPFVIDSADGVSIDVIEWNVFAVDCDALMSFVGASRGVNINILRCESGHIAGGTFHSFVFNSSGFTRIGLIIAYNISVADGVVASLVRITGTGTAELNSVVVEAISQSGTSGVMIANNQDAAGKFRFVGSIAGSGTAWVSGDGGGGWGAFSTLHVLDNGLSVLGDKVVGGRMAGDPGAANNSTETQALANWLRTVITTHGLGGT